MDVVLAAGGAAWESQVLAHLERSSRLRLVRRCVDLADLLAVIGTDLAPVALISTELPGLDLDVLDRLDRGGVRVVPVEATPEQAARFGLGRPYGVEDLDDVAALELLAPAEATPRAPLLAVWGPAGAPGRSSVALALSSALAARGSDTVLVDADVDGGAQAQMLGVLNDVSGWVAACRAANQGRAIDIDEHAEQVETRLRLVSGLPRPDMWSQVRPGAFDLVLDRLTETSDAVVVDCGHGIEITGPGGPGRHASTVQVLERAEEIVVVGRAEPLGLTRLVRALHDLATIAPGRAPRVLINMSRRSLGWSDREVDATVSRLTGITPQAHLPFDQPTWDAAAIAGRTPRATAPGSPFVARVEAFAATLRPAR
ncbi:AAA family ATPase [Aeromicrobium sp. CF3.5]|uniref:AAA family ATPase n=1 Tax=Aeromicrobium sp. CF3.5 TaxID=3373078 RepID=UPI003EE789C8